MRNLKNKLERIYRKAARTLVERGVEGMPPAAQQQQRGGQAAGAALKEAPSEPSSEAAGEPPAPQTPPQSPRGSPAGPAGSTVEDLGGGTPAQLAQQVGGFLWVTLGLLDLLAWRCGPGQGSPGGSVLAHVMAIGRCLLCSLIV